MPWYALRYLIVPTKKERKTYVNNDFKDKTKPKENEKKKKRNEDETVLHDIIKQQ